MTRLTTDKLRKNMSGTMRRVTRDRERVVLRHRGRDVAALVTVEDFKFLEELEDRLDGEAAEKVLADIKAGREKLIPWEEVKKRLKL